MGLRLYGIVPGNGRTPQLPGGVIVLSVRQLAAVVEPVPDEPEAADTGARAFAPIATDAAELAR